MLCTACGTENRLAAKFCDSCGRLLNAAIEPKLPNRGLAKKSDSWFPLIILGGMAATALLIIFIVWASGQFSPNGSAFPKSKSDDTDQTVSSIDNPPAVTPEPPILKISSLKCIASLAGDLISFDIYISGMRTGTGSFTRQILGHNVSDLEYPDSLPVTLYSADGSTVLQTSVLEIPDRLLEGQKFQTTDTVLYDFNSAATSSEQVANLIKKTKQKVPGLYRIFEPEGCSGECVGGIIQAPCVWKHLE